MDKRRLLAVYAHPDDEMICVAGTLRKCADERIETALLYATRGEAGAISDPALATPETLAEVREREMRAACAILGVRHLTFLGYSDGEVGRADEVEAIGRIVEQLRRFRPHVVVTFDENGLYGHPDHLAVHRLTVKAFRQSGDGLRYPEQVRAGLIPFEPHKLYASTVPRSVFRRLREQAEAEGREFAPGGATATLPFESMGVPDDAIAVDVALDRWQLEAKIAAIRAHRTQLFPDAPYNPDRGKSAYRWLGRECFQRILPSGGPIREADLFSGVPDFQAVAVTGPMGRAGWATEAG
jgi:LmbE family N-acetylglucosaminyl deacetylase